MSDREKEMDRLIKRTVDHMIDGDAERAGYVFNTVIGLRDMSDADYKNQTTKDEGDPA
jgi:hypothetical protein